MLETPSLFSFLCFFFLPGPSRRRACAAPAVRPLSPCRARRPAPRVAQGKPQYGATLTSAILALCLPGFLFLFYAAIKKGQSEEQE